MSRPAHGGDTSDAVVDFSSNLHPEPPPDSILNAAREGVEAALRYPPADAMDTREMAARHLDLPVKHVLVGAGSSSLLSAILFSIRPARVLFPTPCFSEYPHLAQRIGAQSREWPARDSDEAFGEIGDPPRLEPGTCVILSNPGNPTGRVLSADTIRKWREAARRAGGWLIVDEAYADFSAEGPPRYDAGDFADPAFLVLRSPLKFHALPGLRAGFALLHEGLAEDVASDLAPWPISTPAVFALRAAFQLDAGLIHDRRRRIRQWTASFRKALESLPALRVRPSDVHFFLLRLSENGPDGPPDGTALAAALIKDGLQIRTSDGMPGLTARDIRVSTRYPEENGKLVAALKRLSHPVAAPQA